MNGSQTTKHNKPIVKQLLRFSTAQTGHRRVTARDLPFSTFHFLLAELGKVTNLVENSQQGEGPLSLYARLGGGEMVWASVPAPWLHNISLFLRIVSLCPSRERKHDSLLSLPLFLPRQKRKGKAEREREVSESSPLLSDAAPNSHPQ